MTRQKNLLQGFAFPKVYVKTRQERRGPGPEALLKRQILDWVKYQPDVFIQVVSVGMIPNGRGGFKSNPTAGCSDLIGVCNGYPLALELKSPDGKLSDLQKTFLTRWDACGGVARVIRSLNDLILLIDELRRSR